MTTVF